VREPCISAKEPYIFTREFEKREIIHETMNDFSLFQILEKSFISSRIKCHGHFSGALFGGIFGSAPENPSGNLVFGLLV